MTNMTTSDWINIIANVVMMVVTIGCAVWQKAERPRMENPAQKNPSATINKRPKIDWRFMLGFLTGISGVIFQLLMSDGVTKSFVMLVVLFSAFSILNIAVMLSHAFMTGYTSVLVDALHAGKSND